MDTELTKEDLLELKRIVREINSDGEWRRDAAIIYLKAAIKLFKIGMDFDEIDEMLNDLYWVEV